MSPERGIENRNMQPRILLANKANDKISIPLPEMQVVQGKM